MAATRPANARPPLLLLDDGRSPKYARSTGCSNRTGTCHVTAFFPMSDRLPQNYGAELLGAEHALRRKIYRDATSGDDTCCQQNRRPLLDPTVR